MNHHSDHPREPNAPPGGHRTVEGDCDRTDREAVILTIARTVSEAVGEDPTDIPPLYDSIDIDALADLFDWGAPNSPGRPTEGLRFQYEGCEVTVFADGRVVVSPPER